MSDEDSYENQNIKNWVNLVRHSMGYCLFQQIFKEDSNYLAPARKAFPSECDSAPSSDTGEFAHEIVDHEEGDEEDEEDDEAEDIVDEVPEPQLPNTDDSSQLVKNKTSKNKSSNVVLSSLNAILSNTSPKPSLVCYYCQKKSVCEHGRFPARTGVSFRESTSNRPPVQEERGVYDMHEKKDERKSAGGVAPWPPQPPKEWLNKEPNSQTFKYKDNPSVSFRKSFLNQLKSTKTGRQRDSQDRSLSQRSDRKSSRQAALLRRMSKKKVHSETTTLDSINSEDVFVEPNAAYHHLNMDMSVETEAEHTRSDISWHFKQIDFRISGRDGSYRRTYVVGSEDDGQAGILVHGKDSFVSGSKLISCFARTWVDSEIVQAQLNKAVYSTPLRKRNTTVMLTRS